MVREMDVYAYWMVVISILAIIISVAGHWMIHVYSLKKMKLNLLLESVSNYYASLFQAILTKKDVARIDETYQENTDDDYLRKMGVNMVNLNNKHVFNLMKAGTLLETLAPKRIAEKERSIASMWNDWMETMDNNLEIQIKEKAFDLVNQTRELYSIEN